MAPTASVQRKQKCANLLCYVWKRILYRPEWLLGCLPEFVPFIASWGLRTWLTDTEIRPAVQTSLSPFLFYF